MNKTILLLTLTFALYMLAGCIMPEYQFCCYSDSAFPEDPADEAVCTGLDAEGAEQTIPVLSCDEDTWTCITGMDPDSGEPIEVPVCPNIETSPCTSNCSGLFCGNFFYDPTPPYAAPAGEESHAKSDDEGDGNTAAVTNEPVGLWGAECRMRALDPLFLRAVENSDDITMGTFRFGVGSSFQDFEIAQYYFPITDLACNLNPGGTVDRYIVYAIPNQKSYGTLCDKSSNIYTCTENGDIQSYSYFDCASRCALDIYGYEPKIEPFNPYLTYYNNKIVGNPFTYAPLSYHYDPVDSTSFIFPQARDKVKAYSGILPLDDNYLTGTTLYGSVFGEPILSLDIDGKGEYYLLELLAEKGSDPEATKQVPTFGFESPAGDEDTYPLSTHFYLDWNSGDDHKAQTIFLTAEQDPHDIYPWLLAHHSIYNEQFETGHRLIDGSEKSGAEFECLTSQDCLSGYCNNFDYSRGTCVDAEGKDILCDCWLEAGKTLCMGAAGAEIESWDNPSVDVQIPVPLPAALDSSADGQQLASLPSIGTVRDITFTSDGNEPDEDNIIDDYLSPMPILILDVGGLGTRYQSNDGEYYLSPDYQVRTWTDYGDSDPWHNTAVRRMNRLLNPCSAVPDGWMNWWSVSWSGASYWSCCDGTSSCCTSDNGYDPEDDTHYCNAYNDALWSGGSLVSRFVENCMAGHKNEISVCYSKDASERMGNMWGWSLGSDTELRNAVEDASEMSFCEYMGKLESKYDRKGEEHVGCYLYESGGHYPMGDNDKCLVESEAYLVIEPTFDEDLGRWFFGNCMIDATGKDLQINQYGTCESCGYLTMAKQEITSLPAHDWDEPELDEIYDADLQANRRTGNMYCPNLVVKTPLSFYDLYTLGSESAVYALTPFMMSGYVQVQYGSAQWGSEIDFDRCVYPNGREVVKNDDDYDMARYRGLPNVLPDAYYLSSKLESLMKRNVQPVLFATDNGLWDDDVDIRSHEGAHKNMEDAYRVAIQLQNDDGEPQWATTNFLLDLYEKRQDLFILAKECEDEEDSDTCTYYVDGGAFLTNVVMDQGAVVVVPLAYPVYKGEGLFDLFGDDEEVDLDAEFQKEFKARGKTTRFLCPNCMIALGIGYSPNSLGGFGSGSDIDALIAETDPGAFDVENRLEQIDVALSDSETASYVDVLALNFYLDYEDDYCEIEDQAKRFDAILANLTYLGTESLKRHGKPIIITDLVIQRSSSSTSCWSDEAAGDFMTYLGAHNDELVSSGYLGIMYGEWDSTNTDGRIGIRHSTDNAYKARDEFYAGVFTGARNFAGQNFQIFYTEVVATDECPCVPCTIGDAPYLCNGRYNGVGPECDGYVAGDTVKWPDTCIRPDTCTVLHTPSITPDSIASCDLLYNNGTTDHVDFPLLDVMDNPTAYRDVIASLDLDLPLCFAASSSQQLTYTRTEEVGYMPTPILFDKEGNPDTICDPMQGLTDGFCGYYPPVTDYRMECSLDLGPGP